MTTTNRLLLIDTPTNKLVNLPSGKLAKNNQRIPIYKPKGMSGILFALRRLAYFSDSVSHASVFSYLNKIKACLSQINADHYAPLVALGEAICKRAGICLEEAVEAHAVFKEQYEAFTYSTFSHLFCRKLTKAEYYNYVSLQSRWLFIFVEIIHSIVMPFFNLQIAPWHPKEGFKGLMHALIEHGAHVFIGYFDCSDEKYTIVSAENTSTRKVKRYKARPFNRDGSNWAHAIVVDQVKLIDNQPMVFFRHPNHQSKEGQKEVVYMIGYAEFVKRLQNVAKGHHDEGEERFGIVSKYPHQLLP